MFHMLSAFDLAPGTTPDAFAAAWEALAADLLAADLVVSVGPVGERRADTPLDTDAGRAQRFFATMSFRDRAQSEAAYARIAERSEPTLRRHARVMAMVRAPVFTCWEDLAPRLQGA